MIIFLNRVMERANAVWHWDGCRCTTNHFYQSNCVYDMDYDAATITIKMVGKVKAGGELFINYNGIWNAQKLVWFDAKEKKIANKIIEDFIAMHPSRY